MKPINFMQNDGFRKQTLSPSYVNPECKKCKNNYAQVLIN